MLKSQKKMKRKLDKILLIDDSPSDNYIHERRIRKHDITNHIIITHGGQEALQYLTTKNENGHYPLPELIFLDINMPGMNGWEFLNKYEKLDSSQKGSIILTMLTTSIAESDRIKAAQYKSVAGYETKPITAEMLDAILQKYFPDCL